MFSTSVRQFVFVLVSLACLSATAMAGDDNPRDTFERRVAKKVLPSTVRVAFPTDEKMFVNGSGFVIDSRGYILTNQHVVEGHEKLLVGLYDAGSQEGSQEWQEGEVVFQDKDNDLAVLKVKTSKPLPEVSLGRSATLEVGEPAIVIGNPKGEEFTVTRGIISRLRVPNDGHDGYKRKSTIYMIKTDAAVNPGNSGGALLNALGEVVGVIELKYSRTEGLAYAITIDRAVRTLADGMSAQKKDGLKHGVKSLEFKSISSKESGARKVSGKSGSNKPNKSGDSTTATAVVIKELAKDESDDSSNDESDLPDFLKNIIAKSTADKKKEPTCPLQEGDQVLEVDHRVITNPFDFERAFWGKNPGDKVEVLIVRDGEKRKVTVKLGGKAREPEIKD
jgi:serine protease Do